ncbi:hypothetical protein AB6D89_18120 [Vibrio splendidus]
MNYINTSCHHIFIDKNTIERFDGSKQAIKNFQEFARSSVKLTQENDSAQAYIFNDGAEVQSEFESYLEEPSHWEAFSERLAGTLLAEQQESQRKLDTFKRDIKVTPGSLLLIHCRPSENDVETLVLIKMEQEEVANVATFEHLFGLPTDKKALNTAFITFEKGKQPDLWVSRAQTYWIKFLNAQPVRENHVNTSKAFNAIENVLERHVKKENHKSDYIVLRNELLKYLRKNKGECIAYNDLVEEVFERHEPIAANFDKNDVIKKLLALPLHSKNGFDKQFVIDMKDVTARKLKMVIELTEQIELTLKEDVDLLGNVIEQYNRGGKKGIIIFTEEGYEYFNKETDSNDGR